MFLKRYCYRSRLQTQGVSMFRHFCYRNLDTDNYWYILILLFETQGHDPPTFSKNWIFVLFCLCGVGLSACQSNSLADKQLVRLGLVLHLSACPLQTARFSAVSTKGRSTVQGLWTRPPTGTKRAWIQSSSATPCRFLWKSGDESIGHGAQCCLDMGNENPQMVQWVQRKGLKNLEDLEIA